ncbi:hypothetical protein BB559_002505, partial [Furculomyces boomerangus]
VCSRFASEFRDSTVFFSGKHKKYCLKKFAHLPDERVTFMSPIRYGSVHDFHISLSRRKIYGRFLMKSPRELSSNEFQHWSIIADMGYKQMNGYLPCIITTKGTNLTKSSKPKLLHSICAARDKIKTTLELHAEINDICVSLTSYHVSKNPSRSIGICSTSLSQIL